MSKVEVDQVDPQSGTNLTLGTSGDSILIPSGVTLANSGTVTGIPASAISSGTLADARIPDLNASKITAGTIATARLGSGTASSSTFLRGDQTYAEAGGGGMDLVSATSITGNVSELSTDAFSSTYNVYKVYIFGVKINGSTNNQGKIQFRTASGNYTSAGYYVVGYGQYMDSGSSNPHNAGQFPPVTAPDLNGWLIPDDNTQSGQATRDFEFTFYNTNSTTRQKNCKFYYGGWDENGTRLHWSNGSITLNTTTALTGFRFFSSVGTAFENEGKMLIYGLKES